jgi:hypothetical protein
MAVRRITVLVLPNRLHAVRCTNIHDRPALASSAGLPNVSHPELQDRFRARLRGLIPQAAKAALAGYEARHLCLGTYASHAPPIIRDDPSAFAVGFIRLCSQQPPSSFGGAGLAILRPECSAYFCHGWAGIETDMFPAGTVPPIRGCPAAVQRATLRARMTRCIQFGRARRA